MIVCRKRCLLFGIGVWSSAAIAQGPYFDEVTADNLPPGIAGRCMDAAAADADGDGDLDIALAMEFEPNILLLNDGAGRFTNASERLPRDVHDSEDVEFVDLDGDGDLDLFLVSEDDEVNELYLNVGDARFIDASDRLPVQGVSNGHAVVDVDDDGDLDLLIGNQGTNRILINDGEARFVDATTDRWPNDAPTQDLELADIDGDGDLDVIVGNEAQNRLFLNANGVLVDVTAQRLPAREDETREIRAVDVDADGDLDLVVANVSFVRSWPRRDRLLINDGNGFFTDADEGALPADDRDHFTVQAVDLDGDGNSDLITPSSVVRGGSGDYRVLMNNGRGRFTEAAPGAILPASANGNAFDIEVADFNGDGRGDLFFCNRSSVPNPGAGVASGGQPRLLLRN